MFTGIGSLAGLLAATIPGMAGFVAATTSDAVYIVSSRGVQFGFGVFALGYLSYTGSWDRYARFRRPGLRDVGAVLGAFLALLAVGYVVNALVGLFGLPHEVTTGTSEHSLTLHAQPRLWPLAFLAWFAFATPAEELFYRGLVQTRLRDAFSATAVVVVLAGACFALSHASFAALSGASGAALAATFIELLGAGIVFGALYEVTDNLTTVAIFHGLTWLELAHTVERIVATVL
ncbi:CPBP family intramembrane glutamic endopeptidase [Halorussus sp. MSC15.2]|uniref:CPBP family intramembrane glutamic endopeptidase n=1 Tax=Halorussus sp. MSC15.2 TaxID=2283638 RepID=UPI0013D094CE|nr:CPBP family intramembrane glutamic endopeptidase [Halorussus sp. MSC15.2]NEU55443.1 CPBP family intramembrane metalloprotease [Halorussus sp. MSC15.2]